MTFRPAAPSFGVGFFLAALAIAGSPAAAQIAPLNPRVAIKVGAIALLRRRITSKTRGSTSSS